MTLPASVSVTFSGMTAANGTYILPLVEDYETQGKWFLRINGDNIWILLEAGLSGGGSIINQLSFKYVGAYLDFLFVGNLNDTHIWTTKYENQWSPETGIAIIKGLPLRGFVSPRPGTYDPDLWWSEELGEWVVTATGGGRYRQQLIAIGEDGEIYFGDV